MQQSSLKCFPNVSHADPLWLKKITTDPHIFARVNTECLDDKYLKLKIYFSELILDSYEHKQQQCTARFDLKLTVAARFVGSRRF